MTSLKSDRAALRDRMLGILDLAKAQDGTDPAKIAAIGFCFGGLCVLDLARSGADIASVASFTACSTPLTCRPSRLRPRSSPTMAGTSDGPAGRRRRDQRGN